MAAIVDALTRTPRPEGKGPEVLDVPNVPEVPEGIAPANASASSGLDLGVLGQVLGFHLARAAVETYALFERHVGKPFQLRKVEYSLLLLLLANAGPSPKLTPKLLGSALALTAPNLTLLVDRLVQRDLVRRERSLTDRRSQHIVLTDAGRMLAMQSAAAAPGMERELLARLSPVERLMLIELLRKVADR